MKINNLNNKFNCIKDNFTLDYCKSLNKENFFSILLNSIISKIKLPEKQMNTSFVDIINIDIKK